MYFCCDVAPFCCSLSGCKQRRALWYDLFTAFPSIISTRGTVFHPLSGQTIWYFDEKTSVSSVLEENSRMPMWYFFSLSTIAKSAHMLHSSKQWAYISFLSFWPLSYFSINSLDHVKYKILLPGKEQKIVIAFALLICSELPVSLHDYCQLLAVSSHLELILRSAITPIGYSKNSMLKLNFHFPTSSGIVCRTRIMFDSFF